MPRFLFVCAYDGLPYRGWQSQPGGGTVQDALEGAFAAVLHAPLRICGAGRTDAGVHAEAQRFHADVPESCRMGSQNWLAALNAHLPGSIRILEAREVAADFHARFSACGKVYEYLISTAPVLSPFLHGRAWHRPQGVDAAVLSAALARFAGRHDFRRFAARRGNEPARPPADFYVRVIYSAEANAEGSLLRLRFHGNGFMYRMVRLLTGTACQVAAGRMPAEALQAMLDDPLGEKSRFCAPAAGLYLKEVLYP